MRRFLVNIASCYRVALAEIHKNNLQFSKYCFVYLKPHNFGPNIGVLVKFI